MSSVRLRTAIPGPRSIELARRRAAVVPRGVSAGAPVYVESATGSTVTDVDGNVLLDFAGGIGTLNVGSAPPAVVTAIQEQAGRMLHTCFQVAPYEGYVAVAEELVGMVPIAGQKKALLLNSGAEALENAVKIARHHTGRQAIVVFSHAYHGRTLLALAMTAKFATYKRGYGPFPPEVYRVPFPYPYRGISEQQAWAEFRATLTHEIGAENVAAVVVEPVIGEGGFLVAPPGFLRRVRDLCSEHGILLVADEVQTGFGRTGTMFACEQSGIEPDLICLAKSVAAGLPLSAVVGRADVMDSPQVGGLGGTFAGNPVACASALASLRLMRENDLPARARRIGAIVMDEFHRWWEQYPVIGDVRGLGAMCAMELVTDRETRAPASEETGRIISLACQRGVLLVRAGTYDNVLRFLAPLVISDDELREGLAIVESAIAEI